MDRILFLAGTANGIARAELASGGAWTVESVLTWRDVRCLAADPLEANGLYAGTQGGGVFHSADRGRTWGSAGLAGQFVKSVAASPHERGVVYVGVRPAALHVTRDGGETWRELAGFQRIPNRWWWFSPAEPPWQPYVQAISISPADPGVLLAGIEFGAVVRSDDGGQTWSRHRRGALRDCHDLTFHAGQGDWAYQAGGTGGGAAVSRDGGRTWRPAGQGLARHYGVACAADPADPEVWYVSVAPGPGSAHGDRPEAYLYRAADSTDWQPLGWEPHPMGQMPLALVTDPAAPGHLFAGVTGGAVWHSPDYGASWTKLPFILNGMGMSLVVL